MTTAASIWALPAGDLAARLTREGGLCSVRTGRKLYDVQLSDGRRFEACGLERDDAHVRIILCAVPGSEYALRTTSSIVEIKEHRT